MAEATHEDAQLLLQLARLGQQMEGTEARGFIWSDKFVSDHDEFLKKYPRGSKEYGYVQQLAYWFETVGTLWKHGLINEELLLDWLAVHPTWERMKDILLHEREESGMSSMWENYEALAEASVAAHV